ncbi:MAG: aldo/keto reductase [Bacteroidales bacterium]|nr:aldo/keto reductase [Bacteroidales bacterium]
MTDPVYSASENRYGQMPYRRCGRSGVLLPALSLGLWHNFGSRKPFADAKAMAHFAFDHGICHFDLANNYGPEYGTAEENFGKLMAASLRPYRDELFISSKAGWDMWPGPYGNWGSRKYLMASLDQSLRRMNIDYVDIFYSHRWDPETPLEETMQALVDIVRQGKALYVGLSRYPVEEAAKAYRYLAERDVPCLLYQDRFNIIDRNPDKAGLIDLSKENGTGFISFSPLQQGLLTNRYLQGVPADSRMAAGTSLNPSVLTKELLQSLRSLDGIARRRGQSLAAMALSWLLRDERVTSVIIGASSVSQLQDNLKAIENLDFTEEELREIDRLF